MKVLLLLLTKFLCNNNMALWTVDSLQLQTGLLFVLVMNQIQSTTVVSNSKGLIETLPDIRTSTYQSWESEENNKLNNHIKQMNL